MDKIMYNIQNKLKYRQKKIKVWIEKTKMNRLI